MESPDFQLDPSTVTKTFFKDRLSMEGHCCLCNSEGNLLGVLVRKTWREITFAIGIIYNNNKHFIES